MVTKKYDIVDGAKRDMTDYRQIARLHIEGINQGFLPQLGLRFMALLYDAIDHAPSSVLLTESDKGRIVGFVSGTASMKAIYYQLLRKPLQLLIALLPSLASPRRLKRIYEIWRYTRRSPEHTQLASLPVFELLSIVVAPAARGTGCADRLYLGLVEYCEQKKIAEFKIIVGDDLTQAHRFYRRMGATRVGQTEVHAGQKSAVYIHRIDEKQELKG